MSEYRSTPISGVYELRRQPFIDERGSFVNLYRSYETTYSDLWHSGKIVQANLSYTRKVGCIRGLHLQLPPHSEAKLVSCVQGRVWDVAVDLRPTSHTYGSWHAVELSAHDSNSLLIPEGCAHGFQALEADSSLLYLHSGRWVSSSDSGIRYDDPTLALPWPITPTQISNRDLALPYLHS